MFPVLKKALAYRTLGGGSVETFIDFIYMSAFLLDPSSIGQLLNNKQKKKASRPVLRNQEKNSKLTFAVKKQTLLYDIASKRAK